MGAMYSGVVMSGRSEKSTMFDVGRLVISVELQDAPGPDDITVDLSMLELRLHCQRNTGQETYRLEVKLPQTVQPDSSVAKFSRRRQVLDIEAPTNVMRPLKHG